jgi:hypothetical protein
VILSPLAGRSEDRAGEYTWAGGIIENNRNKMMMEATFRNAKEAILYTGRKFDRDFNLNDPEVLLNYRRVFHCLVGSDLCKELDMNPEKGILQIGKKGIGKTILMRVMQVLFKNTDRRFKWVDVFTICDMLKAGALDEIAIKAMYGRGLKCDLYIDDIGFGNPNLHIYKNEVNIVAEILFERDELFVLEGFRTHMSSNIITANRNAPDQKTLESLFGDRILDRIKQMNNLITWEQGKSMRGI